MEAEAHFLTFSDYLRDKGIFDLRQAPGTGKLPV